MEKEIVKSLGLAESRTVGDGFGPLVPVKPRPRFGAHSSGLCTCGRKALILSRCVECAMGDHALAEEASAAVDEEADLEGLDLSAVPPMTDHLGGIVQLITPDVVVDGVRQGYSAERPSPYGLLFISRKVGSGVMSLPRPPRSQPHRMLFLVSRARLS